jgi:hypothetical protein
MSRLSSLPFDSAATKGVARPAWFRDVRPHCIPFVKFTVQTDQITSFPIQDLPPPVPDALRAVPAFGAGLGGPSMMASYLYTTSAYICLQPSSVRY